ncbi:MAG: response regulator [Desulfobacterales bacterium]|nr:response regulator [Desulfobacterales bacterium]
MRILLVEDDLVSRLVMTGNLSKIGQCDVAADGLEAVEAVKMALEDGEPYDLICLDIMMPKMDGQQALKEIRGLEMENEMSRDARSRIIMTTALTDIKNVSEAYGAECDAYIAKPIKPKQLLDKVKELGLMDE